MKTLSPGLNEVATIPSWGLMVKYTWLMGPRTSSILPMGVYQKRIVSKLVSDRHFPVSYLVLQIDGGVEVRNLGVDRFANHLAFTSMHDSTHL